MAGYAWTPVSFDGQTLNSGNLDSHWEAGDPGPSMSRPMQAIEASVTGLGDRDVRAQPKGVTWLLTVRLGAWAQANLEAFWKVFSEERGLGYLVCSDGDFVNWQVQARVIGDVQRINAGEFKVPLRVANPVWEAQTATTDQQLNKAGTSHVFSITNVGNRKARPTITITPDSVKTDATTDYRLSLRGFVVNRSPFYWGNLPVNLCDTSGSPGVLNHATQVAAGDALANGDDLRVWIDGVEIAERWLDGANTANLKVWANITMPERVKLTLQAAISAGGTEDITFIEDTVGLPQKCLIACENEVIYGEKSGRRTLTNIRRAVHGMTAAAHTTAQPVYGNPKLFVISTDKTTATPASAPIDRRPCIQLAASTNKSARYGDLANDALSRFYDPLYPDRTAQWTPVLENKGNDVAPLRLQASDGSALFSDYEVGEGKPPYNRLNLWLPQGVKAAADAISIDWGVAAQTVIAELWGRDKDGNPKKLQDAIQFGSTTRLYTPAAPLIEIGLKGRYGIVTGCQEDTTISRIIGNVGGGTDQDYDNGNTMAQAFVLDQQTRVLYVLLPLSNVTSASAQVVKVGIFPDSSGAPDLGPAIDIGEKKLAEGRSTIASTSKLWALFSMPANFSLPAGTYWIVAAKHDNVQNVNWYGNDGATVRLPYSRGKARVNSGSGGPPADWDRTEDPQVRNFGFEVIGGYERDGETAYIQDEMPSTKAGVRTGLGVSFDNVILTLNDGTDPWTPYVHRNGWTAGLYHCQAVISNSTTGESFSIDCWLEPAESAVIDCAARTAIRNEPVTGGTVAFPIAAANAEGEWLTLAPGVNSVTISDPTMVSTDLTIAHRGAKI